MTENSCQFTKILDDYLFLDIQTTGTSKEFDEIIEIGWLFESKIHSQVVYSEIEITSRIEKITGISSDLIDAGEPLKQVQKRFLKECKRAKAIVIHFAQFEKMFLADWFKKSRLPIICTHKIAKLLVPGLRSYSLRSAASEIGDFETKDFKRVDTHLQATYYIFSGLVQKMIDLKIRISPENFAIDHIKELSLKQKKELKKDSKDNLREQRLNAPNSTGVYFLLGRVNKILYIGKASNIKQRLSSHFNGKKSKGSKNNEMLTRCKSIDYQSTESLLEAELLESDLIKEHKPLYNVLLKEEDSRILYLHHNFSKLVGKPGPKSIGPFLSVESINIMLSMLELIKKGDPNSRDNVVLIFKGFELGKFTTSKIKDFFEEFIDLSLIKSKRQYIAKCLLKGRLLFKAKEALKKEALEQEQEQEQEQKESEGTEELSFEEAIEFLLIDLYKIFCRALALTNIATSIACIKPNKTKKRFRILQLKNGELVDAFWADGLDSKKLLKRKNKIRRAMLTNRSSYDRIRIIWTYHKKHGLTFL